MLDKRRQRGADPEDAQFFALSACDTLRQAAKNLAGTR